MEMTTLKSEGTFSLSSFLQKHGMILVNVRLWMVREPWSISEGETSTPIDYALVDIKADGQLTTITLCPSHLRVDLDLWDRLCVPCLTFNDLIVETKYAGGDLQKPVLVWKAAISQEVIVSVFGEAYPEEHLPFELNSYTLYL